LHITISIISIIVYFFFNSGQPKWASEEAARNHHNNMMIVSVIIIAVAIFLYFSFARRSLINQGTIYNNLFSVSLTAILGVLLWAVAFSIVRIGPSNILLNSQLWQNYAMYNGYSLFFIYESGINNAYVFLIFSLIPTITMGIGVGKKG
jgi:heme/copper-type cytochrome/quinol oxidase subunit 2